MKQQTKRNKYKAIKNKEIGADKKKRKRKR